ncbi:Cupredoxin, partial [Lentinula edodes]
LIGTALAAIGPVTDLHVVNKFIQPDGFNRSYILAEGVFPGPLISGKKGDNFQINVINELTNDTMLLSTSIHWHGLFQEGTNWADG